MVVGDADGGLRSTTSIGASPPVLIRVLNLAAGLDARPYRLNVSPTLRWIEVDLPELLAYKEKVLVGEKPRCVLERIALDLSDVPRRRALFAQVGASSKRVMVLSEGLLLYLSAEDVGVLATDLARQPSFRYWHCRYRVARTSRDASDARAGARSSSALARHSSSRRPKAQTSFVATVGARSRYNRRSRPPRRLVAYPGLSSSSASFPRSNGRARQATVVGHVS